MRYMTFRETEMSYERKFHNFLEDAKKENTEHIYKVTAVISRTRKIVDEWKEETT